MAAKVTALSANAGYETARRKPVLATLRALVRSWDARRQQRHYLTQMPDDMLRDMGTSRGDAAIEAVKPFWRA